MLPSRISDPPARVSTLEISPYPRQFEAFMTLANEVLFGGATEGGKSFWLRFVLCVWCTAIPGLQCFLFRRHWADVITNHMQGPKSFPAMLHQYQRDRIVKIYKKEIVWLKTESRITLGHLRLDKDVDKQQGIEKHVLALDEAGQIAERHIRDLRGWVRMPREMKVMLPQYLRPIYPQFTDQQLMDMFPKLLQTSNPWGISAGYFRRYFVKARPSFKVERTPDDEGGFLRVFIPSLATDNFSVDLEAHDRRLAGMADQGKAKAAKTGDWDSMVGDFFREYEDKVHTCPDFEPPEHWLKFRSFDWGFAEPFAMYWWCVSDGMPFRYKGERFWFPRGALIAYREWYGCDPSKPASGLRLTNKQIAKGVVDRTIEVTTGITLSDNKPFQGQGGKTIAHEFAENGCPLTLADCSRIAGWNQVAVRLKGNEVAKDHYEPMLYLCESCIYARDYLPAIERDPNNAEDCVDSGEATHAPDAIRLACMAWPIVRDKPKGERVASRSSSRRSPAPAQILKDIKRKSKQRGRRRT